MYPSELLSLAQTAHLPVISYSIPADEHLILVPSLFLIIPQVKLRQQISWAHIYLSL